MRKPHINYWRIDSGIKDLIHTLNQIPYIATQVSCEGHLKDHHYDRFPADPGHKFLYPGAVIFKANTSKTNVKEFLEELERLEQKYFFAKLSQHHCGGYKCRIEGSQVFFLNFCDLTCPQTINDSDTLEVMVKKRDQVETMVGERRIIDFQKVWRDFYEIAIKYAKK